MKILIIIPAYNEDQNIVNLIKIIQKNYLNYDILIIDDSSNSLTKESIEKNKFKNLEYIKRNIKMGRGNAVRFGFEYSIKKLYDFIIEMDADCSHDPHEIKNLLEKITKNNFDLIIGSRYLNKSKIIGWPLKRRIFSKLANFLARFLFGFDITDYTNGFRIYNRKSIIELMKYNINNHGFIYLTETLVILKKKNYLVGECSTIFINRKHGNSSLKINEIINSLLGIFKIKIRKI